MKIKIEDLQGVDVEEMNPEELLCVLATSLELGGRAWGVRVRSSELLAALGFTAVVLKKDSGRISQKRTLMLWTAKTADERERAFKGRLTRNHDMMVLGRPYEGVDPQGDGTIAVVGDGNVCGSGNVVVATSGGIACGESLRTGSLVINRHFEHMLNHDDARELERIRKSGRIGAS